MSHLWIRRSYRAVWFWFKMLLWKFCWRGQSFIATQQVVLELWKNFVQRVYTQKVKVWVQGWKPLWKPVIWNDLVNKRADQNNIYIKVCFSTIRITIFVLLHGFDDKTFRLFHWLRNSLNCCTILMYKMVVMTSLMKSPITSPNHQNVSLVVPQVEEDKICEI